MRGGEEKLERVEGPVAGACCHSAEYAKADDEVESEYGPIGCACFESGAEAGLFYDQNVDDNENWEDGRGLFPEKRDGEGREREKREEPGGSVRLFGSAGGEKEGEGDEEEEGAAEIG